ncbi:serine/threonine-protein kinase [Calothrix sp. 336/3]|uniref:serine/threonine-protein kinase n=1 Tax=Calothrix sp. 336/3 TaxID=1337936 RepID=UPI0004E3FDD7|nr:serine/threonine-protein kinase [Calothrix sp. 336/3]AKG22057.1 protein kinase [Calothrix sp. 336/3]
MQMLLNNRYRVIQTLGGGGFGETFLAEDTQMPSQRRCVIKQLKPIQDNPQVYQLVQQRFQREAAILEDLGDRSEQIPRLYAYFSENNKFYLVQEYIEGQTLTALLKQQGTVSESTVKSILVSILPVLEYVHNRGIVHRDIKPDNILLRYADGKPVLIDFGAVKETVQTVVTPSGNTQSIVIGTPGFMASEQSVGRPMFASDIYSLGMTAIYLLTGRLPQEWGTDPATGAVLWRQYANVTPNFANILDQAIQFSARDRFVSAREMLEAIQAEGSVSSRIPLTPPTTPYTQPPQAHYPTHPPSSHPDNTLALTPPAPPAAIPATPGNQNTNAGKNPLVLAVILAGGIIAASVVISSALNNNKSVTETATVPTPATTTPATVATTPPTENTPSVIKPTRRQPQVITSPIAPQEPVEATETPVTTQTESPEPIDSTTEASPQPTQTPENTPTPIATITPTTEPQTEQPAPDNFIRNYYGTINQGDLQTGWNQLAPEYQSRRKLHPKGYKSYTQWWSGQVQNVQVQGVDLVETNSETATVDAQVKYVMKNGQEIPERVRFSLTWDTTSNRWLIADARRR